MQTKALILALLVVIFSGNIALAQSASFQLRTKQAFAWDKGLYIPEFVALPLDEAPVSGQPAAPPANPVQYSAAAGFQLLYLLPALALLAISIYLLRANRTFARRIADQQKLIRIQDDTNTILIKEIHHRIKNNLQIINSLIELQLNKADVDYQAAMMEIQSKMGTIALAHHLLYEMPDMKEVDLQAYFESMVAMTIKSLMPDFRSIETDINMNCNKMTLEKLVTLAIAVNEMIINTIKHVFPKVEACVITLACRQSGPEYIFTYKDNGTLYNNNDVVIGKGGMGMRLIGNLIRQMDGHLDIQKGNGGNLEYQIRLQPQYPPKKNKPVLTELNPTAP